MPQASQAPPGGLAEVSGLVKECRLRPADEPERPLPVIALLGRPGSGKTYALDYFEAVTERAPVARIDSSQEGVATAFKTRMSNLCAVRPDVVFFAGRGIDLPSFLAPLKDRTCHERELVVISGDDVSQSAQAAGFDQIKETLRSGNVRLLYTGLAHPGAWKKRPGAYPGWAIQSFQEEGPYRSAFPEETLDDGQAIMGHDAVHTAVSAARLAAGSSEANGQVTGSQVIQIWKSLHGVESVRGASGLISLDNDGSPERKAVPVIEIGADGSVSTLDVSARSGAPLTNDDLS